MKTMKCKKCNKENILDAKYCISCGNKFSNQEINNARKFTFVGILELLDKINDVRDLSIITKNKIVRITTIFVVLLIGFINITVNGNSLKLSKSDNYSIKHYKDTYYVILDKEKTILDLYIPQKTEYLEVSLIDNDESVSAEKKELGDKVELLSNDEDSYYLISGIGKNNKDTLKVKLVYVAE